MKKDPTNIAIEDVNHYLDGQKKDQTILGIHDLSRHSKMAKIKEKLLSMSPDRFETAFQTIMAFEVSQSTDAKPPAKTATGPLKTLSLYDAVTSSIHDGGTHSQVAKV